MKTTIVSICFIVSMAMCGGLVAQDNFTMEEKSIESTFSQSELDTINQWKNPFEQLIGVWSLEKNVEDDKGVSSKIYPGTFMVVHSDAAYTIFVNTDIGGVITSQGNILIESPEVYVEVISQHVNNSMVGISNRVEYQLGPNYLHKSFWIEKDIHGDEYKREVKETWKRAKMPVAGEHEDNPGFPI